MGWFEREYPWIPAADEAGHRLGPGLVNLTFMSCDWPAVTDGRGHQSVKCRVDGCKAPTIYPPGHTGGDRPQR